MPEVPKIVYSRLRAGAAPAGAPDPDLLTAFAEQALPPEEREGVLQHLVVCGDCRELIAIALPARESAVESVFAARGAAEREQAAAPTGQRETVRRNWFGWFGLRGAAVAAGVLVMASVLLLRPMKHAETRVGSTVAKVNTPAEPPLPEMAAEKPAAPGPESRLTAAVKTDEQPSRAANSRQAKRESQLSKESKPAPPRQPMEMAEMEPAAVLGDRKRPDSGSADKLSAAAPAASGAMAESTINGAVSHDASAHDAIAQRSASQAVTVSADAAPQPPPSQKAATRAGVATETVEATAASPVIETETDAANKNLPQTSRSMETLPVQRAKPPVQSQGEIATTAARTKKQALGASSNYAYENSGLALSTTWKLSEGALQHSLDAGSSWQTVLRPDRPLLCHTARGNDIWAAGQAGTVFHSSDGGVTWTQLHPTAKDRPLTADITGIEIGQPGQVVLTLTAGSGEFWITMDNGKTWAVTRTAMTGTTKK